MAIGGVSWLNAACSVPGHLPARTVFVVEQTTQGSGGRWAAINLDRNSDNANTDLDAKAATVCGGCASTLSPYLGGGGRPVVTGSSVSGGDLVVDLTWAAPPAAAQALSNGSDLVTGYGIFYRTFATTPLPATGDATGWVPAADQEADGALMDGYSSDTSASLRIPLVGLSDSISIALGLNFDGSGNPVADANTMVSTYLSDDTDPIPVPTACGESNDLLLESQTISDTQEFVACLSITSGNGFTIGTTGTVTFRAGEIIVLRNGFTVESGGSFSAEVDTSLSP